MNAFILALIAYLIGSVSFAVIVSWLYGLPDPRRYGSGNPGATNVLRSGHRGAAVFTLLGDAFKGWLAVYLASCWALPEEQGVCLAAAGLMVVVGHMAPIFFRFQGGKGVATALGVLLGLNGVIGVAAASTWIIILFFFRVSSLSAIIAAFFVPFAFGMFYGMSHPYFWAMSAVSLLLLWRHESNIKKILKGQEPRVGKKNQ